MTQAVPLYIFDLDGTIALIQHRRHHVENGNTRWDRFYAECVNDLPNAPVIHTMDLLHDSGAEIWLFSGRSDEVRDQTLTWLEDHVPFYIDPRSVMMRRSDDHTADDALKRRWYNEMLDDDKRRLVATFDDRDRVVAMWRSVGVTCFQVAPGNF